MTLPMITTAISSRATGTATAAAIMTALVPESSAPTAAVVVNEVDTQLLFPMEFFAAIAIVYNRSGVKLSTV